MSKFDTSIYKGSKLDLAKKVMIAILANLLMAFGVAFNMEVDLGVDPNSVLSSGVNHFFNVREGFAFNLTSSYALLFVLIFGREYVNLGTIIGLTTFGYFTDLGISFYRFLNVPYTLECRIITSVIALFILFLGSALNIAMNIGLDPWTGIVMILTKVTSKSFKLIKVCVDFLSFGVGVLLGGEIGVVTVCAAILGGPCTQFFLDKINKFKYKLFKQQDEIKD